MHESQKLNSFSLVLLLRAFVPPWFKFNHKSLFQQSGDGTGAGRLAGRRALQDKLSRPPARVNRPVRQLTAQCGTASPE